MNKFSQRLKELREESHISQSQLAVALGCTQSTIAKWESATREPSLESLIAIARFFKISTDYILGLED